MQTTDSPREIVIHKSANRPNQILGGDRELVLIAILTAISFAFSLGSWWGVGLSVAFWVGAVAVLQRMGKVDPLLRQINIRHIRTRRSIPRRAGCCRAACLSQGTGGDPCNGMNIALTLVALRISFCPTRSLMTGFCSNRMVRC
jgi:type IV secretory pathway TrbD component